MVILSFLIYYIGGGLSILYRGPPKNHHIPYPYIYLSINPARPTTIIVNSKN